jgi:hypothetical protein
VFAPPDDDKARNKHVVLPGGRTRNESEYKVRSRKGAASTNLDPPGKGLSKSIFDRTRKMVNYS